jgi:hypothetical protein
MEQIEIIEGNLKATKIEFGTNPNMWCLWIKSTRGFWEDVQIMGRYKIQELFTTTFPIFDEKNNAN